MINNIKRSLVIILIFMLFCAPLAHADEAYIRKLVLTNQNNELVVFFNLDGAFTKGITEAISHGIPTTFTFIIKLNEINNMWFDSSVLKLKIFRTIKYDSLKKQYIVTQTFNGSKEEEIKTTLDFSEAKKAMTEFDKIPLIKLKELKRGDKYELQVKAELEKVKLPFYLEYILVFVSLWDFETDWYIEEFTY